jgi:hypothetical protein
VPGREELVAHATTELLAGPDGEPAYSRLYRVANDLDAQFHEVLYRDR